jgi:membrane protein implicated in regulation of membrane protease activity
MSDAPILAVAGLGAALMAASGALSAERLGLAGVAVMFVAAVWKFVKARNKRAENRRSGDDRRHDTNAQPPVAMGSH